MSVNFPTALQPYLDRASGIEFNTGSELDVMQDGSYRSREINATKYNFVSCVFRYLTLSERDTLVSFIQTNIAQDIVWEIDGVTYIGAIRGPIRQAMTGNRYTLSFGYYCTEQ